MTLLKKQFEEIVKTILEKYKELQSARGVSYVPNLNDDESLLSEAVAYEIKLLIERFNYEFSQLFLETAEDMALDRVAKNFYNIDRLKGSKPTVEMGFNLNPDRVSTVSIPKGFLLQSSTGETARLTEDLLADTQVLSITGRVELNEYTKSSKVKTQIITEPRPFLKSVKQKYDFEGGKNKEDDQSLKERCLDSLHKPSTAGSRSSYEYYSKTADSRIEQVQISSPKPCEVKVHYYAKTMDSIMQARVEKALDQETVVPLGIKISIEPAELVNYSVQATVQVSERVDKTALKQKIENRAQEELKKLQRIGYSVSLFQVKNILAISNEVKNVVLSQPTEDIAIESGQIINLQSLEIEVENHE